MSKESMQLFFQQASRLRRVPNGVTEFYDLGFEPSELLVDTESWTTAFLASPIESQVWLAELWVAAYAAAVEDINYRVSLERASMVHRADDWLRLIDPVLRDQAFVASFNTDSHEYLHALFGRSPKGDSRAIRDACFGDTQQLAQVVLDAVQDPNIARSLTSTYRAQPHINTLLDDNTQSAAVRIAAAGLAVEAGQRGVRRIPSLPSQSFEHWACIGEVNMDITAGYQVERERIAAAKQYVQEQDVCWALPAFLNMLQSAVDSSDNLWGIAELMDTAFDGDPDDIPAAVGRVWFPQYAADWDLAQHIGMPFETVRRHLETKVLGDTPTLTDASLPHDLL